MAAMAGLFTFTACDDLEDPLAGPSIVVTTTPAANDEGEVELTTSTALTISVAVTAPAGFNGAFLRQGSTLIEQIDRNDLGLAAGTTSATVNFTAFTIQNTGEFILEVEVGDEEGRSVKENITIVVADALDAFSTTLLYAPTGNFESKTFFSTNTGLTYSMGEVNASADPISANIDFGYFYGQNLTATLASPAEYPFEYGQAAWGTRNDTKIKKTTLTESQFLEATSTSIEAAFNAAGFGNSEGQASALATGNVIVFRTDNTKEGGAKYGLALVKEIVGTDGSNDYISLDIVVQK